jgi:hypothetical protein
MGVQKGAIKIKGKASGHSHYKSKGRYMVRKSGGPSRKQIMTLPAFKTTRENITEFGGCSKIAKAVRLAMIDLKPFTDGQFGNRLTQRFKYMIDLDEEGSRGQRKIELSANRDMLEEFECNIARSFTHVLPAYVKTTHNKARNSATLTVASMQTRHIKAPKGATAFRIVHLLGIVSDFVYDRRKRGYKPANTKLNTMCITAHSDYLSLRTKTVKRTTIEATLDADVMPNNVSVIQACGVEFFQEIGKAKEPYPFKQGRALMIAAVF